MFKATSEFLGNITRRRRILFYTAILSLVPLAMGCFGHFPMTSAVYQGNRNVYGSVEGDNTQRKMAQSAVMWVFLPIYAGAAIGDMAVFNLIEFWTGSQTNVSQNQNANEPARELASSAKN